LEPQLSELLGISFINQGHLHRWSQHFGSSCESSPHPFQELSQVSLNLLSVIFCEAVAIYGVIMAIILQGKINESKCLNTDYAACAFGGYALFWTGVSVGFSNLFCGYDYKYAASVLVSPAADVQ